MTRQQWKYQEKVYKPSAAKISVILLGSNVLDFGCILDVGYVCLELKALPELKSNVVP